MARVWVDRLTHGVASVNFNYTLRRWTLYTLTRFGGGGGGWILLHFLLIQRSWGGLGPRGLRNWQNPLQRNGITQFSPLVAPR